jgi:Tfp pilus assembly protein PilF
VQLEPDHADSWVGLGPCHLELGQPARAREELTRAKDLHRRQGNMAGVEEAEEALRRIRRGRPGARPG